MNVAPIGGRRLDGTFPGFGIPGKMNKIAVWHVVVKQGSVFVQGTSILTRIFHTLGQTRAIPQHVLGFIGMYQRVIRPMFNFIQKEDRHIGFVKPGPII
jgi:hypothetical protein